MTKKVIQVPVDEELLKKLNKLSKKQRKARSQVIREACVSYIAQLNEEELDRIYIEGYKSIPEDPAEIEALTALAIEALPKEEW